MRSILPTYGSAKLIYRATRDGWASTNWHAKVDLQGATVTYIKSTTGQIFGAFTSMNQTGAGVWVTDPQAFLFSATQKVKLPVTNSGYAFFTYSDRILYMGSQDLYVPDKPNAGTASFTTPGNHYTVPPGTSAGSAAAITFLHGSSAN